jgi:hypothetical protein
MRISSKLSLLLAAASTHVSAQTTTTSSAASASTGDRETGVSDIQRGSPSFKAVS